MNWTFLVTCLSVWLPVFPTLFSPSDHLFSLACLSVWSPVFYRLSVCLITCLPPPVCLSVHLSSLACLSVWSPVFPRRSVRLITCVPSPACPFVNVIFIYFSKNGQLNFACLLKDHAHLQWVFVFIVRHLKHLGLESYIEVSLNSDLESRGVVWNHTCIILDKSPRVNGIQFSSNDQPRPSPMRYDSKKMCVNLLQNNWDKFNYTWHKIFSVEGFSSLFKIKPQGETLLAK